MYRLLYSQDSVRQLKKLDTSVQRLITSYMKKIGELPEPRAKGKPLSGQLKGFWRYRVQDFRVICEIDEDSITIFVIDIGHRSKIY